jgi:hypothetical protein
VWDKEVVILPGFTEFMARYRYAGAVLLMQITGWQVGLDRELGVLQDLYQ